MVSPDNIDAAKLDELLRTLKARFEANMQRHKNAHWENLKKKLESNSETLQSLYLMEITGGEPDVIAYDETTNEYIFCDCSAESPKGRRSLCYDQEALASRKEAKPVHSAVGMAEEIGVELLSEAQYRDLQKLGVFDTKTSSWILTPPDT